jgi:hypothetical protein
MSSVRRFTLRRSMVVDIQWTPLLVTQVHNELAKVSPHRLCVFAVAPV